MAQFLSTLLFVVLIALIVFGLRYGPSAAIRSLGGARAYGTGGAAILGVQSKRREKRSDRKAGPVGRPFNCFRWSSPLDRRVRRADPRRVAGDGRPVRDRDSSHGLQPRCADNSRNKGAAASER